MENKQEILNWMNILNKRCCEIKTLICDPELSYDEVWFLQDELIHLTVKYETLEDIIDDCYA